MTSENVKVGRWLPNDPDHWWECDGSAPARCVRLHGPSVSACRACGTKRPSMTEMPAPRPDDWPRCGIPTCSALATYEIRTRPEDRPDMWLPRCDRHTSRAGENCRPLVPPSDPRFLTDAQVVGKEPIVGVSEAMIDAAMRADGFGYAAISDTLPDLVAQTREWYRRILSAALRAVPVEGGEPWGHVVLDEQGHLCGEVHRFKDSRARAEQYCAFLRVNPAQRVRVVPLYAHPAPDGDIRTALLRFIDTAGNKRDLVTPGQTCALLDLLNELHPEDRPDAE